jgi:hypothetical protein
VGSKVGLDAVHKGTISCPCRRLNSGRPASRQSLYPLANSHTLQITTAHNKASQFIFTIGCLVTDPNNVLLCSRRYRLATVSHLTHCSNSHSRLLRLTTNSQPTAKLLTRVRIRDNLRLAVYRQTVRIGAKFLETHDQRIIQVLSWRD